ncbi:MAG: SAM-dependent methyltransferase, partial [Candidatus Latescibacterota bacterium]
DGPPAALLAPAGQTLAVYMGVRAADRLQAALLAAGQAADTPVAVVQSGTTPRQRVHFCRLGQLAATVQGREVAAPALVFVGPVVARAPGFASAATPGAAVPGSEPAADEGPEAREVAAVAW